MSARNEAVSAVIGKIAPQMSTGLNSLQMVCAREIAKGRDARAVKKQYAVNARMWAKWMADPRFAAAIESHIYRADQIVLEVLADGEAQAAQALVEALSAVTPIRHKDGKIRLYPDHDVRVRAAISLLDRRGERGKPVERRMQGNVDLTSPAVQNELIGALADPTVRAFLDKHPARADQLRHELLLASSVVRPPEPPPCDAPLPPSSSSASPAPSDPPTPSATTHPPNTAPGTPPSSSVLDVEAISTDCTSTSSPPPPTGTDATDSAGPPAAPSGSIPTPD